MAGALLAATARFIGMVCATALDFADKGVRVNATAPGFIETEPCRTMPSPRSKQSSRSVRGHALPDEAGPPQDSCPFDNRGGSAGWILA